MTRGSHLRAVAALFWSGNRSRLLAGAALSLITVLAGIALLGLSGWFITATAIAGLSVATALAFDVFAPSAGIRFLALARTASRYGERLVTHDATLEVLAALREKLFRGWARADAARAMTMRPAQLLFRLTLDIDALDAVYLRLIVPALSAAGAALLAALALGFISPALGIGVGLALLATGFGLPALAARRAEKSARRRAHALEALRSRVIDLVRGQTDLAMANRIGAQRRAIGDAEARLSAADDALNRTETAVNAGFGIASAALLSGILLTVALLAERGAIDAPVAAFALLVGLTAIEPFTGLRRGATELGRTMLAIRRIGPRLARTERQEPGRNAPEAGTAVRLDRVTAAYPGAGAPALDAVSLVVGEGERVALIGASGAGKSSLLAAVAGELPIRGGLLQTRRATLFTQRTELFHDTLRGNLQLAGPEATDVEIAAALEAAGLGGLAANRHGGIDAVLGEGGIGLSAGQARRLALARLLLQGRAVWLLDEATEGLDGETARDVIARVEKHASGKTMLIATHIRREAEGADRILLMESGRIVAEAGRGSAEYEIMLDGLRPD
ncbi:amino acid ABC transporter ATP-binding/permease protein [Nitratireductor sp. ZSWI3]|uniref:amino acid ABC transporter ATP-binding/permease protein n=1 Tax=Nitratireductor sp. ZSWI3 TaxID=2966359 RepID=UPI00214F99BD|nr:ATP-binding cassette domain-containing protein [Nitratireductor sp. ZSWI3]MCR4269370.1 ATP-binding cassette domain-containing protein [Nitratireductor sp. ZSWI3]